jgi:nucleoside-triphosphatase THEP1
MNHSTDKGQEKPCFAAAVYTPHEGQRDALAVFAEELTRANVRVGGLLQEAMIGPEGRRIGIDLVEVDTGARIPINRPTKENLAGHTCSLNTEKLADSTEAIRRAVRERFDLIVLEKFGEQEQNGQGLMDEIFLAISEEIPLLIAVPQPALPLWRERSGDLGDILPFELDAFRDWWSEISSQRA